jgi:hypothetical protein
MIAKHLFVSLALVSMLSSPAIAAEPSAAAQDEANLLREQEAQQLREDFTTQATAQAWIAPWNVKVFATYLFVRTDWQVYNPNSGFVDVNVRCDRYGYDAWYRIPPYSTVSGRWGCEGELLHIYNNASLSNQSVLATVW